MILYSLDREKRIMKVYIFVTIFTLIFGMVYELCSHGIFSFHMAYLFIYPLIGGVLPYWIIAYKTHKYVRFEMVDFLWNSGIATLIAGSLVKGVIDIYGTESPYIPVFYAVGIFLMFYASVIMLFHQLRTTKKNKD